MNRYVLTSILLSGAIAACDEGAPESEYTGPAIEIAVAPLNLPGITNVSYRLLIENSLPNSVSGTDVTNGTTGANNVVYLPGITAITYGNGPGGDISYVAPCDASVTADLDGNGTNGVQNAAVTLWVESITPSSGFVNPCPLTGTGCKVFAACTANADTFVEFNLTVMRDAQQGFFDVAVNFEDIFCSGKLDSQYTDNTDITLLHSASGARQHTAVGALACTHGGSANATAVDTKLWIQNPTVTCTQVIDTVSTPVGQFALDLTQPEGNREADDTVLTGPNAKLRYAIYKGAEALVDSTTGFPLNKRYWNFAINLGSLSESYPLATCVLNQYHATARVGTAVFPTWGPGVFTSWPFVRVAQTTLTTPDPTPGTGPDVGVTAKFRHALNGGGNVTTFYAETTVGGTFQSFP